MRKFFFYGLIVFCCLACSNDGNQFIVADREEDIHAIIETIAKRDSSYREVKILSSLKRINIILDQHEHTPEGELGPVYDMDKEISIKRLINQNEEIKLFSETDVNYLASQNDNPDSLSLNKSLLKGLNFIEFKELNVFFKRRDFNYPKFVEYTIPFFSKDNTIAFVQEGYHCGGTCGHGREYILKKINGKWVVVEMWGSWIN